MDKTTKIIAYSMLGFVITLLSATIFYICYRYSTEENSIYLEDDNIIIDYFGFDDRINISEINSISFLEELPDGGKYGAGIEDNHHIAADAKFETIGKCKAYIIKTNPCAILIKTDKNTFLINDEDSSKTSKIYDELLSDIEKSKLNE